MSFKLATLSLALLALQGCAPPRPAPKTSELSAAPTQQAAAPEADGRKGPEVSDIFVEGDELTFDGYVVRKLRKRVTFEDPSDMKSDVKSRPFTAECSYAVLKRKGRVLATFDGVCGGVGNGTRFGLFPFLGGDEKQLLVSQDVPRGGTQWVVSLSKGFRVIFDGDEFGVGREGDDMTLADMDGDGVYELKLMLTAFYGFADSTLSTAGTPLPTVVFRYDEGARKYLPANRHFARLLLADAEESKKKVPGPEDRENHLSDILSLVLDYVLAGEEQAAWAFYEEAYRLPDKAEMKKKIKAELSALPLYRFTYKGKTGH